MVSEISCEDEEHEKEMKNKLVNITFDYLVMNFTKNVNRILRGNNIDVEPTNQIEKQAKEIFKKKKNIGKYVPKVDDDHDESKKSVIKECACAMKQPVIEGIKPSVIKKDVKKKSMVKVKCDKKSSEKGKVIKKPVIKTVCDKKAASKGLAVKKEVIKEAVIIKTAVHKMQLRNKTIYLQ